MARFFWDLLVERSILPAEKLQSMQQTAVLDEGWSEGGLAYGAGLMLQQANVCRH